MAGFSRLMLWMILFIGGAGFLTLRGALEENAQFGVAGALLVLLAFLMFTGGNSAPPPVRKQKRKVDVSVETDENKEDEEPVPVSRTRGVDVISPEVETVENEDIVEVEVMLDDVVEAKEYVVEVDAQSMLETEIETEKQKKGIYIDPRGFIVMDDCLSKKGSWAKDQPILELLFKIKGVSQK